MPRAGVPRVERTVQTSGPVSPGGIIDDEARSITRSPSVQPGPSDVFGLQGLADVGPNERPPYSNFTLVKHAILGSPNQKLTLAEIYVAISDRFPWFQTAGNGWKNSVRHCLSLDTQFHKEARPRMLGGKGCYWKVSLDTPRGNKRERKRKKKPSKQEKAEARQRAHPPHPFSLSAPPLYDRTHDYATTIPVTATARPLPPPSNQSGWTPYFSPAGMKSAPTPPPGRHYAEVTCHEKQIPSAPGTPSTNPYKLSSAYYWAEEDEMEEDELEEDELDSDLESEDE